MADNFETAAFDQKDSSTVKPILSRGWFKQYFIHRKFIHVRIHEGTGSDSKQSAYTAY